MYNMTAIKSDQINQLEMVKYFMYVNVSSPFFLFIKINNDLVARN